MNERLPISGEKTGFAATAKSLNSKKYGATNKKPVAAPHLVQPQSFLTHQVVPSDTIQGLSLRYGVTPELLKRFNNLYTNDSIHLKTTLKIPVLSSSLPPSQSERALHKLGTSSSSSSSSTLPPSSNNHNHNNISPPLLTLDADLIDVSVDGTSTDSFNQKASLSIGPGIPPMASFDAIIPGLSLPPPKRNSPNLRLPTSNSVPDSLYSQHALPSNPRGSLVSSLEDEEDKSVSSILNKIDSMLLKSKEDVKQYEKRKNDYASKQDDDDESFSYQSGSAFHYYPHGRGSRSGHQKLRQEGYTDLDGSPELVIKGGARRKEGKKTSGGGGGSGGGKKMNHRGLGYGELEEEEDVIFEL